MTIMLKDITGMSPRLSPLSPQLLPGCQPWFTLSPILDLQQPNPCHERTLHIMLMCHKIPSCSNERSVEFAYAFFLYRDDLSV